MVSLIDLTKNLYMLYRFIIIPIIIVIVTILTAKLITRLFQTGKIKKIRQEHIVVHRLTVVSIYILGILMFINSIPQLKTLSYSLFAGAGILAVAVGFAMQKTFANFVSGLFIIIFKPFRIGDKLKVQQEVGTVEDITLRHTVIRTWENKRIIVPNALMSEESVINYSIIDPKILKSIDISISYDSDIDLARKIMLEEARNHQKCLIWDEQQDDGTIKRNEPMVRLVEFLASSVQLRLYVWAPDQMDGFRMGCDLNESIKKRFDKEGVEIPYPYLTLVHKEDLALPKQLKVSKKKSVSKNKK